MANARPLLTLWLIAAACQVAGDIGLLLSARELAAPVAWLEPRLSRPLPDSVPQRTARFLRDTLGITTQRHADTMVVTITPPARQAIDERVYLARQSAAGAARWGTVALILLNVPLLLAIGVTVSTVRQRAAEERNRAMKEWTEDA
jgi:hypothetical protein